MKYIPSYKEIGVAILVMVSSAAFAIKTGPFGPMPSPSPSQSVNFPDGWSRFENTEVICYAHGSGSISCYWKPVDDVDGESEDPGYAKR